MEDNFINSEIIDIVDGRLMFNSSGLVYKDNLRINIQEDEKIEINARFEYTGGAGVAFFIHDDLNYISFELNNKSGIVSRVFRGKKSIISIENINEWFSPIEYEVYEIKVVLNGFNIKTYIKNNTSEDYILINNCDQSSFLSGYIGLVGVEVDVELSEEQDSSFSIYNSMSIKKKSRQHWDKNIVSEGVVIDCTKSEHDELGKLLFILKDDNHDYNINQVININNTDNFNQEIRLVDASKYTLSIEYIGSPFLAIQGSGELVFSELPFSDVSSRSSISYTSKGNEDIRIYIGSTKRGFTSCSKVQLEKGHGTLYTQGDRDKSFLSFPVDKLSVNNLMIDSGAISVKIKPINENHNNDYVFYYNDSFNLKINNNEAILTYSNLEVSLGEVISDYQDVRFTAIWNEEEIILDVYNCSTEEFKIKEINNTVGQIPSSKNVLVGCSESTQSDLLIDDFKVIASESDIDLLRAKLIYNDKTQVDFVVNVSFDKETLIYNENKINIPFFDMNSPLIVEDVDNNITYSRVAFFDDENNSYNIYNKERHLLYYTDEVVIDGCNILKVWAIDSSGNEYNNIVTMDETIDGEKTGRTIVVLSDVLDIETPEIDIFYILRDTYCITEDKVSGNYLIEMSNVYGGQIDISIEQETESEELLLRSVEANPFMSTNNTGFVFLEEEKRPVRFLYANASPDSIVANGYDRSVITIDCLDKDSVRTNNVYLYDDSDPSNVTVYSKYGHGKVELYMTEQEKLWWDYLKEHGREACERDLGELINDENRAGRYIFIYTPHPFSNEKEVEREDYVVIVDGYTQISTEIAIRIVGGW